MNELAELRKYMRAILRRWWLLLLFPIVAGAGSYYYTSQQPEVYEATATVIVGQAIQSLDPDTAEIETSDRLAMTYALIVRRQPIMQGTADALGLEAGWRQLRSQVHVYLIPGTQLIEITVEAESTQQARLIADEVAQQLVLQSPTDTQDAGRTEMRQFAQERLKRLEVKIRTGQTQLDDMERTLAIAPEAQKAGMRRALDALEGTVSTWEGNYSRLLAFVETDRTTNYVAVIEPAQSRGSPVSPDVQTNTILAAGVGLLLALVLVFVLEYIDDTFKSEEDVEQALGLARLGTVYTMKGKKLSEKLITSHSSFSPASEAYRFLRSNIRFVSIDKPYRSMMITSASPGEGKSTTAANLAVVMAQAGLETILVDADLRQPKQHSIFGLPNDHGLTDALRSAQCCMTDYLHTTDVEHLHILTSGELPPNPTELLGSRRMALVLESLAELADVVVLDSVPVLPVADAVILSNQVDGVVLVVDAGHSRRGHVVSALQKLNQAEAHVWGAVLNRVTPNKKTPYYVYKPSGTSERVTAPKAPTASINAGRQN